MTLTIEKEWVLPSQVDSIDFDYKGHRIVCGASNLEGNIWDGSLHILDLDKNGAATSVTSAAGISTVLFLGTNSECFACARDDGNIAVYVSSSLEQVELFFAHDDIVSAVVQQTDSPDTFASIGWDGCFCIWSIGTSGSTSLAQTDAHDGIVTGVAAASGANMYITVGQDRYAKLWDVRELSGGCSSIYDLGQIASTVTWSSSHAYSSEFYVGLEDGGVLIYDSRNPSKALDSFQNAARVRKIRVSPANPNTLLCALEDATVTVLQRIANMGDMDEDQHAKRPKHQKGICQTKKLKYHTDHVTDIFCISAGLVGGLDKNMLLTSSWDKRVVMSSP